MFHSSIIAFLTYLLAIGYVSGSSSSVVISENKFDSHSLIEFVHSYTVSGFTSTKLRGTLEVCTLITFDESEFSDQAKKEALDIAAKEITEKTIIDFSIASPTLLKDFKAACNDKNGDTYLFDFTSVCSLFPSGFMEQFGNKVAGEIIAKNVPACFANCPGPELLEVLFEQSTTDPNCKGDNFDIKA